MLPFLIVPALVLAAPAPALPDAVQVYEDIWVLKSAPNSSTYPALKAAGFTHVINLRGDGEPGFDSLGENNALAAAEIVYIRLVLSRSPSADDLDLFRTILRGIPSSARILIHCGNGNRAAAALCGFLVLDKKMNREKALTLAREAGMSVPETERALASYLDKRRG